MVLLNTELEINQSMQILMDRNGHHGSVQTKAEHYIMSPEVGSGDC